MDLINRYRISETLGETGSTISYLAVDTSVDRAVVLKSVPSDKTNDADWQKSYLDAADDIQALKTPVFARVLGIESEADHTYVVREYVDGQSLAQMAKRQPVHYVQFLELALAIARSLKKWHDADLCHGNLKPGNILFEPDNRAVLTDPYLSLCADDPYRAPELAVGAAPTVEADLYSLGASLWHLASDEPPSQERRHLESLTSLGHLLIDRLMAVNLDDRFQSVDSVIITLEEMVKFRREHGEEPERQHRFTPRQYLTVSVLAILLVILWLVITSTNH